MKYLSCALILGLSSLMGSLRAEDAPKLKAELPKPDADGFINIFNGKDLTYWDGLPDFWEVRDGAIAAHEVKEKSKQTFLVFQEPVSDFELHIKYKFVTPDGNSGVQFRSKLLDAKTFRVGGYQADFDAKGGYDGCLYDEASVAGGRGVFSNRGEKVVWSAETKKTAEPLGDKEELKKNIKVGDWNDVVLIAKGNHVTYSINGKVMTDMTDDSPKALKEGVLALQCHGGFTMEIHFKDIKIKFLNQK
jgi:hypothetical protein